MTAEPSATPYGARSLWFDSLAAPVVPRPPAPGDLDVDVAVVGGGYTGLWTAYYLARDDPSLRVAVLERDVCGAGASGRNGGWCSALFAASWDRVRREAGAAGAGALRRALQGSVDEVGGVAAAEGIDCHFSKGGWVGLARGAAQLARARDEVTAARQAGAAEEDFRLLHRDEAAAITGATGVSGGTYTPHCAAVQPALLVRGLAAAVERRGVHIHEQTPVLSLEPGGCRTPGGRVRAEVVVRATESYTAQLPGMRRRLVPVYSLMIATEPLPPEALETVGLRRRETFSDGRHVLIYGQRTADGRLAFGGRGAPYHYASRTSPRFDRHDRVHRALRETLVELFPVLRDVAVTHRWGGSVAIPRDWFPSIGYDRAAGVAWAGGYVGDGVAAANLAGRTLADLVQRKDTDLVRLAWVGHRSPAWEPEPLRWLGINVSLLAMSLADRAEARSGRPSRLAGAMERLLGG